MVPQGSKMVAGLDCWPPATLLFARHIGLRCVAIWLAHRLTPVRRLRVEPAWLASVTLTLAMGCAESSPDEKRPLRLAVTTSTRDSGLLDELLPACERTIGCTVHVLAVGSGAALGMARAGDVDALIVHSVVAEEEFMQGGFGARREFLMSNEFLLLGPAQDPVQVAGQPPAAAL